jgi:peptidyl-prolyl cis-trans isomerase D
MISWIQRTFQHHFRLIFALLLIGMVVPFIFTIGSTPGIGRPDHKVETRDFFGHNLASQAEIQQIHSDGSLSAELQFGQGASPEQIEFYSYQRIAALHLADQMHLPLANEAELPDFIKSLRIFAGPDGNFDGVRYENFRKSLGSTGRLRAEDITRILNDDVRAQKIEPLLAGPGYVLPAEVTSLITKGDTTWTLSTASVDYASFEPELRLTDAEISKFFTDNAFRYTIPPRVVVDAVSFSADTYLPQVAAATDAEVRDFYDANPGRFPNPAAAKTVNVKADPAADFAAVRDQVKAALGLERARRAAVKAASDTAFALYDSKIPSGQALDAYLASHKLKVSRLAPFTADAGPAELGGAHEISTAAFELNAERYYSEALPTPSGAVILLWRESLPTHDPLLAEVRDRVRADATDNERRKRFVEFGRALKAGIERRVRDGEPFERAASEAAGTVRVAVRSYPSFTLVNQPKDIDPAALNMLDRLDKGAVSDMEATASKGILVYVADRKMPVISESSPRYTQLRAQMAQRFSRQESVSLLGNLVEDELKRTDSLPK